MGWREHLSNEEVLVGMRGSGEGPQIPVSGREASSVLITRTERLLWGLGERADLAQGQESDDSGMK